MTGGMGLESAGLEMAGERARFAAAAVSPGRGVNDPAIIQLLQMMRGTTRRSFMRGACRRRVYWSSETPSNL